MNAKKGRKHQFEFEPPKGFQSGQVAKAVDALLDYHSKNGDQLFMDEAARFLMNVCAFKTIRGKNHFKNIILPHSPWPIDSADILFVMNDVKGKEPEEVVNDVKDLMIDSPVKIREILTFKQLRDDFHSFEAKRKLAKSVDVVIVEGSLLKIVPKVLGREFFKKKKFPLTIPGRNQIEKFGSLPDQILYTLKKTVLNMSLTGQTSTVVFGHSNLTSGQLTENVVTIVSSLQDAFPGGFDNIASLSVYLSSLSRVPPLVIYFKTGSGNEIKKPPTTGGHITAPAVVDELSTIPGKRARVFPTGEINIESDSEVTDEDDKEILKHITAMGRKQPKPKVEPSKEEMDEDEDHVNGDAGVKDEDEEGESDENGQADDDDADVDDVRDEDVDDEDEEVDDEDEEVDDEDEEVDDEDEEVGDEDEEVDNEDEEIDDDDDEGEDEEDDNNSADSSEEEEFESEPEIVKPKGKSNLNQITVSGSRKRKLAS